MPAERKCTTPGCSRKHYAKGLCKVCYDKAKAGRALQGAVPRQRGEVVSVLADFAYPDQHRDAPGGQKIAVYTCPACGHTHIASWLPVDPHPGLKTALCRSGTAMSPKAAQVYVLAPAPDRILDAPPPEYGPRRRERVECDSEPQTMEATVS